MNKFRILFWVALAGCFSMVLRAEPPAAGSGDAAFNELADEYLTGFLAWRPLEAMQLGFHEYDGKLTDYSRASIGQEWSRLQEFDRKLAKMKTSALSPRAYFDFRDLRAGLRREMFSFQEMGAFSRNPMTYTGALDVSPYIKRDFAPLEERTRGIIAILNQAPEVMAAARANLEESLPKPWVETAIEEGGGTVDFLEKDLVDALKDQAQEGAGYSLEEFHNEFLRHGMPPVPLLREILLKDRRLWDKAL